MWPEKRGPSLGIGNCAVFMGIPDETQRIIYDWLMWTLVNHTARDLEQCLWFWRLDASFGPSSSTQKFLIDKILLVKSKQVTVQTAGPPVAQLNTARYTAGHRCNSEKVTDVILLLHVLNAAASFLCRLQIATQLPYVLAPPPTKLQRPWDRDGFPAKTSWLFPGMATR